MLKSMLAKARAPPKIPLLHKWCMQKIVKSFYLKRSQLWQEENVYLNYRKYGKLIFNIANLTVLSLPAYQYLTHEALKNLRNKLTSALVLLK